jgi:L-glyceraldehyde 3-phosphate reductase
VRQLEETAASVQALAFTDAELAAIDEYAVEADINLWAAQSLIP